MFNRKTVAAILAIGFFVVSVGFGVGLKDDWNDLLHYTKIGRLDLAKGYAQAVLNSKAGPVMLLALSEANPAGYAILVKANETTSDAELAELTGKILAIVEQGRFARRTNPKVIVDEIKRLSGTTRGRLTAVKRLADAGEYVIPYMLDALADENRRDELSNIIWALPQIGKDAIRPLAAALQTTDVGVKAEIIKALGKIGYPQALAYLRYVSEKEPSGELRDLARQSIRQIDPAASRIDAAHLFYQLGEDYYYHAESLTPMEKGDLVSVWFWDGADQKLFSEKVDRRYFNELMAMRCCEWALRADVEFGQAIGLWQAAYFKAESVGIDMPDYFGKAHASASVYATTAGAEYLHQALARAVKDKNAYVALQTIEALATTAGEKSLFYRLGVDQPLVQALSFGDRAVRYSAAIAIAAAGPKDEFPESKLVVEILAEALWSGSEQISEDTDTWNKQLADEYTLRAAKAMLKLAQAENPVIDLSGAQSALIDATKSNRTEIQKLSGLILAHLSSAAAQSSIAAMALDETNSMEVRLSGFESLAVSAKLNASLLDNGTIDAVYSLVRSQEVDPQLRSTAAAAFGALNLPSRKVKNLILDQSKS